MINNARDTRDTFKSDDGSLSILAATCRGRGEGWTRDALLDSEYLMACPYP